MGIGGISIWQLLIVLVIVLLLFGTKKLRGMGGDLGSAIKSFKKAVTEEKKDPDNDDEAEEKAQLEESSAEKTESESAKVENEKA